MFSIKKLMPEKIPALGAVFYSAGPARVFEPHYRLIAGQIVLEPGQLLVDVGTGPGKLPIEIALRNPQAKVMGIDLSPKMIDIALRNKVLHSGLGNLEFEVMDARRLNFADASVDRFVSTGAYHHWKEPLAVLDEMHRCLKPGGLAWIYDGYADAASADIAKSIKRLGGWFPPDFMVRRIMGIHGFSKVQYETLVKDIVTASHFGGGQFEPCGVMMRIALVKR